MATVTVFSGLNDKGRASLKAAIFANVKSHERVNPLAWEDDVRGNDDGVGAQLEIGSIYSRTGCPVIVRFGADEITIEEVEIEE